MTQEKSKEEVLQRRIIAACVMLAPWALFLLAWLLTPGYVVPWLYHPTLRLITLTLAAVSGVLFWVLQYTKSKLIWTLVIVMFVIPICALPMLGPAIVTIRSGY